MTIKFQRKSDGFSLRHEKFFSWTNFGSYSGNHWRSQEQIVKFFIKTFVRTGRSQLKEENWQRVKSGWDYSYYQAMGLGLKNWTVTNWKKTKIERNRKDNWVLFQLVEIFERSKRKENREI